ncbi:MAG: thioredoxin domain-containing protein, partial [Opitutales bacterium]
LIAALRPHWERMPQGVPALLAGLEWARQAPATVVLAGDPGAEDFRALAAVLHESPGPVRAVLAADNGAGQHWLAERRPYLAGMKPVGGRAAAYVCENFACRAPADSPGALRARLAGA